MTKTRKGSPSKQPKPSTGTKETKKRQKGGGGTKWKKANQKQSTDKSCTQKFLNQEQSKTSLKRRGFVILNSKQNKLNLKPKRRSSSS